MPGFDGTGPFGRGPLTGRGMGYCMSAGLIGSALGFGIGRRFGRGLGMFLRGRGRGKGFGAGMGPWPAYWQGHPGWWGYDYAPRKMSPEVEQAYLQERAVFLKEELEGIKEELALIEEKLKASKKQGDEE